MANKTIYPYGTDGQLPSSIGLINNLVTGGVDKALTAEQGKEIGNALFGELTTIDLSGVTISPYGLGDKNVANYRWSPNGLHFVVPVVPGETIIVTAESSEATHGIYGFLTSSYSPPQNTNVIPPYVAGTDRVFMPLGTSTLIVPEGAAYICCCPRDGSSFNVTWTLQRRAGGQFMTSAEGEEIKSAIGEEREILFLDYQQINFNLENSSTWASSTTYKCILIPVADLSRKVHIVADTYKFSYAFLRSNNASNGVAPDLCIGTSIVTMPAGNSVEKTVPQDCNYMYVYMSVDNYALGKIHLYNITTESKFVTKQEIGDLVIDEKEDKKDNISANNYSSKRFTIFHFSDLHLHQDSLNKILEYRDKYAAYCNDAIFTGDLVNLYQDSIDWWTSANTSNILYVLGNHEIQNRMYIELTSHIGLDAYNKFIKPFIANWGTLGKTSVNNGALVYDSSNPSGANIFQPSTADTIGQCYYFKDYGIGVRLIVLDWLDYDTTQKEWFEAVLADSLSKNKSVIVSAHFPSGASKKTYNLFDVFEQNSEITDGWLPVLTGYDAHESIRDFIDARGKFVCWLCGHRHRDTFTSISDDPRQACIMITSSRALAVETDLYMTGDTACNLFSVDITNGRLYIQRIGAKETFSSRNRNAIAWDYINHEVIREAQ